MQIVIDINENDYKTLMINGGNCSISMAERIIDSVYQGTPLPKGHGRLIDADKLKLARHDIHIEEIDYHHRCVSIENIDEASTIMEADAESGGKEDEKL